MTDWYSEHFREITLIPDGPPDTKVTTYPDGTIIIRTNEQAMLNGIARKLGTPAVIATTPINPKDKRSPVRSITVKTTRYELAHPPAAQPPVHRATRTDKPERVPRPGVPRDPTDLLPKALRRTRYDKATFDSYRITGVKRSDQKTVITIPRDGIISLTTSDSTMLTKLRNILGHKGTAWRLVGVTRPLLDPFKHHIASVTVECDEPLVTLRSAGHKGRAKS